MNPKAFVSHSTADQDRFVRKFAERLRANGVDVWYSEWALNDGDSLVDKIFEVGIGEADIFIVVLSERSVQSRWVTAELNAAVIFSIERTCRLMPVVLDDVEIPVALADRYRRVIHDVEAYDAEFDSLLRSIFNGSAAPPLGPTPAYSSSPPIRGLTAADSVVFDQVATLMIETGSAQVDGQALDERCRAHAVFDEGVVEGVMALRGAGFVERFAHLGGRVIRVTAKLILVRTFVELRRPDTGAVVKRLLGEIVNGRGRDLFGIAERIGVEPMVARSLLTPYAQRGLLRIITAVNGHVFVDSKSPLLRRELD